MPVVEEGALAFHFPDGWDCSAFDKWAFFKGRFSRMGDAELHCRKKGCIGRLRCDRCLKAAKAGVKGLDIVAVAADSVCWNIEVKDYRTTRVTDYRFLADVVALKLRDTLACLTSARAKAHDALERDRAKAALSCNSLRVVLHLETPPPHHPLMNAAKQRTDLLQRLRLLLKGVDDDPLVLSLADHGQVSWTVRQVATP